jgi:ADP-ribose pyrophosphatase
VGFDKTLRFPGGRFLYGRFNLGSFLPAFMEVISSSTLYAGHLRVRQLTVDNPAAPADTAPRKFEVVSRRDAVAALVYDPHARAYLLVEQWRAGAQGPVVELPAGLIDGTELPETALRRELLEELGVEVSEPELIATFYTSPGFCTEQIFLYYAVVTARPGAGGGLADEGEEITIHTIGVDDFYQLPLFDGKSLVAQQWARGKELNQVPH